MKKNIVYIVSFLIFGIGIMAAITAEPHYNDSKITGQLDQTNLSNPIQSTLHEAPKNDRLVAQKESKIATSVDSTNLIEDGKYQTAGWKNSISYDQMSKIFKIHNEEPDSVSYRPYVRVFAPKNGQNKVDIIYKVTCTSGELIVGKLEYGGSEIGQNLVTSYYEKLNKGETKTYSMKNIFLREGGVSTLTFDGKNRYNFDAIVEAKIIKHTANDEMIYPEKDFKLVWLDDFDKKTLDFSKWDYRYLGPRQKGINTKESVKQDPQKGVLQICATKSGSQYLTGMISTQGKFETKYGYFEAKVKLQKEQGSWSAFWLQSPTYGQKIGDLKASGAEIDIYEFLKVDGNMVRHNVHIDGYNENLKSVGTMSSHANITEGWHTFGVLWEESGYKFYVDRKLVWETNQNISHHEEFMILSLEIGDWGGDISKAALPDCYEIDYVKVYKKQ